MDPLAFLKLMGTQVLGATATPDPTASAARLAQLGDPDAFAMLFPDALSWNPSLTESSDPLLMQPTYFLQQNSPLMAQATQPPVLSAGQPGTTNPQTPGQQEHQNKEATKLTAAQMKELMGLMPQGQDMRMPQAPSPPLGHYSGNMQMLQPGQINAPARPTLAQLLYGRR
jgi:hypothetical protein